MQSAYEGSLQAAETPTTVVLGSERRPPWRQTLDRLRRNQAAMAGIIIVVALVLIAIFAPSFVPFGETDHAGKSLTPPNSINWAGTDVLGRDVFSRIMLGTRISLSVGVLSVAIGASVGLVLGLIAGYYLGKVDAAVIMFVDTLLAFPGILLAIAIVAVLGPGLTNVMIAVGISAIPAYTRLVRGSVLTAREQEYVTASQVTGCGPRRMMFLPHHAEHSDASDRPRDARHSNGDSECRGAELPRAGRAAALARMGGDGQRRTAISTGCMVAHRLPRRRHHAHGAGDQPVWGRSARRARSAIADLSTVSEEVSGVP